MNLNRIERRSRNIWEDSFLVSLREIGCEYVEWIDLVQDKDHRWALVNKAMNLRNPL
jgi:hypothetical protein